MCMALNQWIQKGLTMLKSCKSHTRLVNYQCMALSIEAHSQQAHGSNKLGINKLGMQGGKKVLVLTIHVWHQTFKI